MFKLLAVLLTLIGVAIAANNISPRKDNVPERYPTGLEELPETTEVNVPLDQAIEAVKEIWSVSEKAEVEGVLLKDNLLGKTFWLLTWRASDENLLVAKVDANNGEVASLLDFRCSCKKDNLKNETKALEIGLSMLRKLGIPEEVLSAKPIVKVSENGLGVTYSVLWTQVHAGLPVLDGYALVKIDAETLKPMGFAKQIINVEGVDVKPDISEKEALDTAVNFLKDRGYDANVNEAKVKLVVGRPNYYWEGTPKELGEPTLLWQVSTSKAEVWIDAHTGEIVGGNQWRCL